MSKHKSNVHPGQYKVAGRERQGEDVVHARNKAMLTQSQAALESEPRPERSAPTEERTAEQQTLERARRSEAEGKHGTGSSKQAPRKAGRSAARSAASTRARKR